MYNLVYMRGIDNDVQDQAYRAFYWELLNAAVTGTWPDTARLPAEGEFRKIVESAGDPAAFQRSLVDYCDFRLARAFQYDGVAAKLGSGGRERLVPRDPGLGRATVRKGLATARSRAAARVKQKA